MAGKGGPLQGLTVLDLTIFLSGPFCTQLLAGLGAQVIKIERPVTGDGARANPPYFGPGGINFGAPVHNDLSLSILKRNRGKKSITLNLGVEEGSRVFKELVRVADVVVENFRPGVVDKLGVGYEALREMNPRLVYCSISGFGQYGPYRDRAAFDVIVQAMSGLMAVTGFEGGPPLRTSVSIADLSASLYAAVGILAAVCLRERTGLGQRIDVAMLDSLFSLVFDESHDLFASMGIPARTGNRRPRVTPFGVYEALDGHVAICAPVEAHCHALFRVMGRDDLLDDPRYCTLEGRYENAAEVDATIEAWTVTKPKQEICNELLAEGVPCGTVTDIQQVVSDCHLLARDMIVSLHHPRFGEVRGVTGTGMPIKFSSSSAEYCAPAPMLGQHTEQVLSELLGYDQDELAALKRAGAL